MVAGKLAWSGRSPEKVYFCRWKKYVDLWLWVFAHNAANRRRCVEKSATVIEEIGAFVDGWQGANTWAKEGFLALYRHVSSMAGVEWHFVGRPGVSFSLRPRGVKQDGGGFFAIIDVIDDDPAERWLSVCFYGDMITDPEGRGEVIPGGLAGADGYCFDVSFDEPGMIDYLKARCREAWTAVS